MHARAAHAGGSRKCERGRHRARSSARRNRRANRDDSRTRDAATQGARWPRNDVHRSGSGNCNDPGAHMTNVEIVGAGTMGHGIGYVTVIGGYMVTLTDVDEDVLERARAHVGLALDSGVMRGKVTEEMRREAMSRITLSTSLEDAIHDAQIVIEAAPENLALKRDLFRRIGTAAPHDALLATNTSSLSVTDIAAATDCCERVVGMHFFNPVAAMKLVEVIRGAKTTDQSVARARTFAESLGKKAIVVRDSPGFATSRLGIVLGLEAMRMLEQGVATAMDIDTA